MTPRDTSGTITSATEVREPAKIVQQSSAVSSKPKPTVIAKKTTRLGKKKNYTVQVLLSMLLLGVLIWFFFLRTTAKTNVVVRFAAADQGSITKSVTATGTLQATKTVLVGSQVSGTIRQLYADFNSHVTQGQLLAVLDPTFYEAQLRESKANLAKAEADLTNAKRAETRSRDLLQRQLIAKAEYETTQTALLDAESVVTQQQAEVNKAEVNLGYTTIRSPISGVVTSRNVDVGQTVAASLNAPTIFIIAQDLAMMQLNASVDEADIGSVQSGQQVTFTVDAYPGEEFSGTVWQLRLNAITQQNVVTYSVIINVDNPGGKLLPGMTATVRIITASHPDILRVPSAAVNFDAPPELLSQLKAAPESTVKTKSVKGGAHGPAAPVSKASQDVPASALVYVERGPADKTGKLNIEAVKVLAGMSDGTYTEVTTSGGALKPGDSVVVSAYVPAGSATAPSSTASPFARTPVPHH